MERYSCEYYIGYESYYSIRDLLMDEKKTFYSRYSIYFIEGKPLSSLKIFVIGAISKIIATLFTYPYTLLRTRQQIKTKEQKLSLTDVFKDIMQN